MARNLASKAIFALNGFSELAWLHEIILRGREIFQETIAVYESFISGVIATKTEYLKIRLNGDNRSRTRFRATRSLDLECSEAPRKSFVVHLNLRSWGSRHIDLRLSMKRNRELRQGKTPQKRDSLARRTKDPPHECHSQRRFRMEIIVQATQAPHSDLFRILVWEKIITTGPKISLKSWPHSCWSLDLLLAQIKPQPSSSKTHRQNGYCDPSRPQKTEFQGRHPSTSPDFTFFGQDIQGFGYELPTKASRQGFEGFDWTGNGKRF
ncbi:uncharacterized protein CIMG_12883 [Coccidioides immitis RS]|uniref:Uncharacterized protein n=1 Tax=Coccidioides immitis (strain RS) TaxID=246410 RepID=A0A0D8JTN7_COCIM|nr:uncharacterized protein CIMG_12883 [Coccidioides immitis RS]KJF60331.1 hypothetical protein CIMG_12883 [Coccidioides immitis RS]